MAVSEAAARPHRLVAALSCFPEVLEGLQAIRWVLSSARTRADGVGAVAGRAMHRTPIRCAQTMATHPLTIPCLATPDATMLVCTVEHLLHARQTLQMPLTAPFRTLSTLLQRLRTSCESRVGCVYYSIGLWTSSTSETRSR